MFDDRRDKGPGSARPPRPERMRAFVDAPTVISPLVNDVDHLPQILADFAPPHRPRLAIEAEFPDLPMAVRIDLGPSAGDMDERIAGRNAIGFLCATGIHVDTENGPQQVAEILSGLKLVGDAAPVAGRQVQISVRTEAEVAPVVTAARPLEDHELTFRIGLERFRIANRESRDPAPLGKRVLGVEHARDEYPTVLEVTGMKGQTVHRPTDVDEQCLLARPQRTFTGSDLKREDFAVPLGDPESVRSRDDADCQGLVEPEPGKRHFGRVRRGGIGSPSDPRRGPWHPRFDSPRFASCRARCCLVAGTSRRRH